MKGCMILYFNLGKKIFQRYSSDNDNTYGAMVNALDTEEFMLLYKLKGISPKRMTSENNKNLTRIIEKLNESSISVETSRQQIRTIFFPHSKRR